MPDLSGPQFFDPKPYFTKGGQGKLFRDPKPTTEHRYPRGYTPERHQEVRESLSRPSIQHQLMGDEPNERVSKLSGPPDLQRHFIDTVARSTVPVAAVGEQLNKVNLYRRAKSQKSIGTGGTTGSRIRVQRGQLGIGHTEVVPGSTVMKVYHGTTMGEQTNPHVSHSEIMSGVIVHELGHVHEAAQSPASFLRGAKGHLEHYADRFAVQHFRPDPREHKKGKALDPELQTYPAMHSEISRPVVKDYPDWSKYQRSAETIRTRRYGHLWGEGESDPLSQQQFSGPGF